MHNTTFRSAPIITSPYHHQIFEGAVNGKYNVSELGMTYFLSASKNGEFPFVTISVLPKCCFRGSTVYINKLSGMTPEDLNVKKLTNWPSIAMMTD